jgi:hypothetical protein
MDSEGLTVKVLSSFEASQILLVEWENSLFERLGYPVIPSVSRHLNYLSFTLVSNNRLLGSSLSGSGRAATKGT